jgi:hypothetical protein
MWHTYLQCPWVEVEREYAAEALFGILFLHAFMTLALLDLGMGREPCQISEEAHR